MRINEVIVSDELGLIESTGINQISDRARNPHATRVLLVLTGVALLVNYVETMVIPGIPTIQKDLSTTESVASWITSAYLIVGSAISPLFGKLGDVYGKKRMFLASLIFYILGVGLAGFAPSIYLLILARALQGMGFAIIPLGIAIITDVFPREKVATAQGIISGTFALGAAAGLIIGSYVVQDLGWQYAFHTALILSIIMFFVAYKILVKDQISKERKSIDYVGAGMLMSGITLILLYITESPHQGWYSFEELLFIASGTILSVSFFFWENGRPNALIDLRLLKIRNVLVANIVGIVSGVGMFIVFFAVIYYAQLPLSFGLNLDIIGAGLTLAPATLAMLVGGPLVGKLVEKRGPKPGLFIGATLMGMGMAMFLLNRSTSSWVVIDVIVALGGLVSTLVPLINMVAVSLPKESVAVGLGMNTMLRNLGGAIGPVLATTIMTTYTSPYLQYFNGRFFVLGELPSAKAFDIIFEIGIILTVITFIITLAARNYTFTKK